MFNVRPIEVKNFFINIGCAYNIGYIFIEDYPIQCINKEVSRCILYLIMQNLNSNVEGLYRFNNCFAL